MKICLQLLSGSSLLLVMLHLETLSSVFIAWCNELLSLLAKLNGRANVLAVGEFTVSSTECQP